VWELRRVVERGEGGRLNGGGPGGIEDMLGGMV
jgi:hypothetical protein